MHQLAARAINQTNALLHFLKGGFVDHAGGLRSKANVQGDVIGRCVELIKTRETNALLFRHTHRNKRIMPYDLHSEGLRPPCHFHADPAQACNAQRLTPQFRALQRFLFPLAGMHERVRATEMASHGQHHAQSVFCHGHGIGPGRVHHRNTLPCSRIQIDVIDPHAGPANDAQLLGIRQQRGIRLHRRAHNQSVGVFEVVRQVAVQLVGGKDGPAGLL
jgi:hypothetical protein